MYRHSFIRSNASHDQGSPDTSSKAGSDRTETPSLKSNRRHRWSAGLRLLVASVLVGTGFVVASGTVSVDAAACAVPATDMGTDEITLNVPATATYTIWTRMKAPDATHNSINLQVDGTTCYNVGGGSFTATSWASGSGNWIKYQNGTPSNTISMNLTAGSHKFKYIGTQAGVEIDRIIISSDASCTPTGTGNNCQSGDSTNPTVALQAPTNGQTITGSFTFKATASDASGVANVQFLVNGNPVNTDTTSPYEYAWNSAGVTNGSYKVSARATDTQNNTATTPEVTVNVSNAVPCTGNPSVPANLRVTGTTTSSVSLAWNNSTAAANCTMQGYRLYRNGALVGSPSGTTYTDTGLTPGAAYSYTVAALDTTGHASAQSAAVSGSTTADTTAPSKPAGLTSTMRTATAIALSWTPSTDNVGLKDYIVYRNGTQVGTPTTNSFTDNSLAPNTAYSYTVKARDLAGNQSESSVSITITTMAGTGANLGDMNGNGLVELTDLSILLSHWGQTGVAVTQGDVNGDGKVTLTDLSILLSNWGKNV